ncbi:ATP-binding protein [Streptomyces sp. NPDC102467]|uniref:ATP-binding protein n=1 Tax=Streptomyces sp. NPDC102467 TaxID=3366179 RepID=UPI003808F68F
MAEHRPDAVREDTVSYTPAARSVPLARRRAARLAAEWGHPDLAGDVALVVSELMTNALLHGGVRDHLIRVGLYVTDVTLRVEVSDPRAERQPEARGAPDGMDQFGRGLLLVGALADRWGWESRSVGKTVWAQWGLDPGRKRGGEEDGVGSLVGEKVRAERR